MKILYRISLLFLLTSFFFSGCTLHFKAKELELDSEHTPKLLNNPTTENHTFELTSIDFAKD